MSGHLDDNLREPLRPGDPGYRPPGPPDPPYIPGDLGAPSAEEFARRRGDVVQCSRCGQFSPPVPVTDDVAAAWVEAECENERLRAERDAAIAALEKIADDERERIVAKLRFFGFPVAATMVEGDA